MRLIESSSTKELNDMVVRAYERAIIDSQNIIKATDMLYYLEEELLETMSEDIEDFMEDFGISLNINSFDDINKDILEVSGLKIPNLSIGIVSDILLKEEICFFDERGVLLNDPQVKALKTRTLS
jgi:hypothetical protein